MTDYLGISMVIIVISLCIAALSSIVYTNIFKALEEHKRRVSNIRWGEFAKFIIYVRDNARPEIDKMLEILKMKKTEEFMEKVDEHIGKEKEKGVYEESPYGDFKD